MLSYPVILAVSAVALSLLAVIVYLVSGSITATILVVAMACALVFVLQTFGILTITPGKNGIRYETRIKRVWNRR